MRVVLDTNVLVSALLTPHGSPGQILQRWFDGAFEMIVSPLLLEELERTLAYPKISHRISASEATEFIDLLRRQAGLTDDPGRPPTTPSPDPGDDYLIVLAEVTQALIVTGDGHLFGTTDTLPVVSPQEFLQSLDSES
ncbi:MAG: putative toxin-antitoxin system toxin component, PIN family [Acidimicrobiia bacterium]